MSNDNQTNNLKYFVYCRKSSDAEDRQIKSIPDQLRELKEYIEKWNLNIVETLTESNSAFVPGRKVFNEMMARFEKGEANALLVWHLNRVARNPVDSGQVIWFVDNKKILQVETPSKQYGNTPDDKFYMALEFTQSKKYSDDLSEVVKRGIRGKFERGEYPNLAPIGYINFRNHGISNIEPDPESASLIRKTFQEYATGKYSLGQMTKTVFSWGLRTRRGKPVSKSHLHRILQNTVYFGLMIHEGNEYWGSFEPLIEVQTVLTSKSKPKKLTNDWAYAGLMKCGCGCGANVIFEHKRKFNKKKGEWQDYYYSHSSRRCSPCNQPVITLSELEKQIDEKLAPVTIDEETWCLGIKLLNKKYESEAKRRADVVKGQQRQFQRIQDELDGYFKMRAREEITTEEFVEKKKNLLAQQKQLQAKINEGFEGQRTWLELAEDFFTIAFQAREMLNSDDLEAKRKAVQKVGWNLMLKDERLIWTYQKPYDVLLKPTYRSDLRRGWDSNPRSSCLDSRFQDDRTSPLCDLSKCGGGGIRTHVSLIGSRV
ncbi:MAG: Recombinase [Candidatus Daviesbacteria bacterium GW2011_GWB1_41_5]|uniref:Recombinase n=1 Tax=Candidatus Daviesbacteria bacterium GW2011_GWB1_41_5 TaxID=1618429 RepID=A0A0G0WHY8_9BACT|nr:MAG: Recombinase [Candidatus Daviesbacteria bacterium GW2011_GWB1_41_5]